MEKIVVSKGVTDATSVLLFGRLTTQLVCSTCDRVLSERHERISWEHKTTAGHFIQHEVIVIAFRQRRRLGPDWRPLRHCRNCAEILLRICDLIAFANVDGIIRRALCTGPDIAMCCARR
jgi:hypothetical protein